MEKHPPRRSTSLSTRHAVQSSPPVAGGRFASPIRPRNPPLDALRKPQPPNEDAVPNHGLWPSTAKKTGTLGEHLANERRGIGRSVQHEDSLSHQISCSEDKETEKGRRSKENRPMKYFGKLAFPRPSKHHLRGGVTSVDYLEPGRMSVDENSLSLWRRSDNISAEFPKAESEKSISSIPEKTLTQKPTLPNYMKPTANVAMAEAMITRSNSYRASTSQWALSPGRPGPSPPTSAHGSPRSFSVMRPRSPGRVKSPRKVKGVGNFMNSLGFDLFRKKPSSFNNSLAPSSSLASSVMRSTSSSLPPFSTSSPKGGGGIAAAETTHQLRLLNNQLLQWRYLNAKSDETNHIKSLKAEVSLRNAWGSITNLHTSVVQKRVTLDKEKLCDKLNTILSSQTKELEEWAEMETQHFDGLSTMKDCLHSVVCRVPLIDGAKADSQIIFIKLRHAAELTTNINTTINMFAPVDQSTLPLLSELTQVAQREKALLEECFELLGLAAALQIQEESLKCHLIQLKPLQHQELSS